MSGTGVGIERRFWLWFVILVLGLVSGPPPAAGQPPSPPGAGVANAPLVLPAEQHDTSPPLSEMAGQEHREAAPVFREIPRHPLPRRGPKPPGPDPVTQSLPGALPGPAPRASFDGVGNVDSVLPPDTNGAVGPNHYVQWVNLSFAVYDKAGNPLLGPTKGNTLWQGFGGPCETSNDGDPIVLYDHLADRWLMSQFALPGGSQGYWQCIAVSQTADPTGAYHRYAFKWSSTKLNDYPKFGVWPDGYYMAVNQFTCSFFGCSWAGQGVAAFERDQMLAGATARMVAFDLYSTDPNLGGMLPSSLDGPAPPAGTHNYFVQVDDDAWGYSPDQLQIWKFEVSWGTSASGTFSFVKALGTAAFDSNMCGYATSCIPQRGTSRKVDALADRLMYRLQYRSFGDHQSLVVNHTVDVDGTDHAGIRWYELRDPGSGWQIQQQGTYAPDTDHRWMGSIAMDQAGNIALGFSVSGKNTYPSIRYTGRLGGDTSGQMTLAETSIVEGGGSQTYRVGRWGDYSSLSVDPVDGCTFWYTQEYYSATSSAGWKTRIASFTLPLCGGGGGTPSADLAITKTDSPDPVQVGQDLTYTITVTNNGPDTATGVGVTDPVPATVSLKSATASQGTCSGTATVTCNLGSLAGSGTATVTIVVTPNSAGGISNTATVGATSPSDPNPANNSATAITMVNAPPPPPGSAPVVDACSPSNGSQNQQLVVQVTGSNFQSGASVSFGDKVMVQGVTFVDAGRLDVQIKVHPKATSGPRDVTVTDLDGQSGTKPGCFTVN
ncbi:MAG: DUF11 domain-containing protein [Candidatus Rokubacteria bacterium]|nr:DUF11 domain-containing protein [Candidatus Rokubacteria bacterium]